MSKQITLKCAIVLFILLSTFLITGGTCFAQADQPEVTNQQEQVYPIPPEGFDQVRDGIEKGKLERVDYDATAVAEGLKRWMEVYTPAGYSTDKKYPVLYLHHGIGGNEKDAKTTINSLRFCAFLSQTCVVDVFIQSQYYFHSRAR